ncbi:MAG: hypothetical protein DVB31_06395 [Verrucomicrobia bacterium]|nr:MAG: hypothetical protein DVB31_06395 [Verrucomicrobiota bacterium]
MKLRLWKTPAILTAGIVMAIVARAQGTFTASNAAGPRTHFVTDCDGKPLSGTNFVVGLLVKNPASGQFEGGLQRLGSDDSVAPFSPEPMRTGKLAGIFSFGMLRVPFVPAGKDAQVLIRVWDASGGKDFAGSALRGETNLTVRLGGASSGGIPSFPGRLSNFRGLVVCGPAK